MTPLSPTRIAVVASLMLGVLCVKWALYDGGGTVAWVALGVVLLVVLAVVVGPRIASRGEPVSDDPDAFAEGEDEPGWPTAHFPLFDADVALDRTFRASEDAVAAAIESVGRLDATRGAELDAAVRRYRLWLADLVDDVPIDPVPGFGHAELGALNPIGVWVRTPEGEGTGVGIVFSNSWAPEDGLEWTLLDGRTVYVGPAQGYSPWDVVDDETNFARPAD